MIFRLYTAYNNHKMIKLANKVEKNRKYYLSNNFAADCNSLIKWECINLNAFKVCLQKNNIFPLKNLFLMNFSSAENFFNIHDIIAITNSNKLPVFYIA